ncbi:MAG TPA: RtcB family protein, partial [Accumulibacter sp.]|nr:RtcB family protein [Accumulibacter sp.]
MPEVVALANGRPIWMWTAGVPVEPAAREQLLNTARLPFIFHHLAVMPDVHLGKGSTIGSVIPTRGAIIPAAVGVDIGCGMIATRSTLNAADLPDSLRGLRSAIEAAVP